MKPALKPSIRLVLKPSLCLAWILSSVSVAACLLCAWMPLPIWGKLLLILLIAGISIYLILRDALLALPWSWREISLNAKDEIVFTQNNDLSLHVEIQPSSVVMPLLTVLNVKPRGRLCSRSLVLLSDSADTDELRRWRAWLKWGLLQQTKT